MNTYRLLFIDWSVGIPYDLIQEFLKTAAGGAALVLELFTVLATLE